MFRGDKDEIDDITMKTILQLSIVQLAVIQNDTNSWLGIMITGRKVEFGKCTSYSIASTCP
jgi:hypothetical protein